jgi:hypothetical protein
LPRVAGPVLTGAGLAPFLLAAFAWHIQDGELEGGGLGACPLREATGIPCAGCGASRAFYFAVRGDTSMWSYNWVWPMVALLATVYGLLLTSRSLRRRAIAGPTASAVLSAYRYRPAPMVAVTLGLLLVPWVIALTSLKYG